MVGDDICICDEKVYFSSNCCCGLNTQKWLKKHNFIQKELKVICSEITPGINWSIESRFTKKVDATLKYPKIPLKSR